MSYRVVLPTGVRIECDSLEEAMSLSKVVRQEQPDNSEDAPLEIEHEESELSEPAPSSPASPAAAPSPPREKRGGKLAGYRQRVVAYLLKTGHPVKQAVILEECDIPRGSSTLVIRNQLFVKVNGLIWLANKSRSSSVTGGVIPLATQLQVSHKPQPAAKIKLPPHLAVHGAALERKLKAVGKPLDIAELRAYQLMPDSLLQRVVDSGPFDRTGHGVWLAGVPLPTACVEECRNEIRSELRHGPAKPATLASRLGFSHETVLAALDHEDFEPDLTGYRLTSSRAAG